MHFIVETGRDDHLPVTLLRLQQLEHLPLIPRRVHQLLHGLPQDAVQGTRAERLGQVRNLES